jgi:hypothetical protein
MVRHAVRLHARLTLSYWDFEDLLAKRALNGLK